MIIGLPVIDGHELTDVALQYLTENAMSTKTKPVVIDNASSKPYFEHKIMNGKAVQTIRNEKNTGYYQPLKQLFDQYPDEEYIGLMHNDLILYERGWDLRMVKAFEEDPKLGLIGLCGSREVDAMGGRGMYTVCNFQGKQIKVGDQMWKGQDPSAGRNICCTEPAIVLDSLFMLFRRSVIPHLEHSWEDWNDITLAHFYDRIWPIRTIESGHHVITMGSNCDHIGGMSTAGNQRYRDDCIEFLDSRGIPYDNPETEMYLLAERRYLDEYKHQKKWLPAIIREDDHAVTHLAQ